MAFAVDSRLAYARLSAVATASRLPTANRGSNNSYTTSWDTTLSNVDTSCTRQMVGGDFWRVTRHGWSSWSSGCLTRRSGLSLPPPGSRKEAGSTLPVARPSAGSTGVSEETALLVQPSDVFRSPRSPVRDSFGVRRSGAMNSRKSESARREILGTSRISSKPASSRVIHSGRCIWDPSGCRIISITCPRAFRRPRQATLQPDNGWNR